MMNVTNVDTDKNHVEFLHLKSILDNLNKINFYETANGHCISTSEILKNIFEEKGIKSYLIECKAIIQYLKPPFICYAIGYDIDKLKANSIDTHVVLITETNPPYLVDASIAGRLPGKHLYVLTSLLNNLEGTYLYSANNEDVKVMYEQKQAYKLPPLYQQNIIERLKANAEIKNELSLLKKLNYVGIGLSIFALVNIALNIIGVY